MPRARCTGGCSRADSRTGATTYHRCHARHQCFFNLLRADEMNVGINATGRHDHAFAGDDFSRATDGHSHIGLNIGIACFTYRSNATRFDADICFYDTPMIHNHRIGDDGVHHIFVSTLRLTHAIANDFATTEFNFFAIRGVVFFNFNKEFGIS